MEPKICTLNEHIENRLLKIKQSPKQASRSIFIPIEIIEDWAYVQEAIDTRDDVYIINTSFLKAKFYNVDESGANCLLTGEQQIVDDTIMVFETFIQTIMPHYQDIDINIPYEENAKIISIVRAIESIDMFVFHLNRIDFEMDK